MHAIRLKPIPSFSALRCAVLGSSCLALSLYGSAFAQSAAASSATAEARTLPAVTVTADKVSDYAAAETTTATRTNTPLRDVPQSITVITQQLIKDQGMQSMADVVRYVPGIGMAQGEGNRETPIFRGSSSTSDFFVDGMRDDVQYYRDLYNIERVEALKGPNGMVFGRGGSGGVINRVSKEAGWSPVREVTLEAGSNDHKRVTIDINQPINDAVAFRLNAMHQDSDSYRNGVWVKRSGINPTLTMRPDSRTRITVGAEYFEDDRIADRGIPSSGNRPVKTDDSTFFGNSALSTTGATVKGVNGLFERELGNGMTVRNRTRYAEYDKFYQNVFASGAVTSAGQVPVSAYSNATTRENLFNQTDLIFSLQTGAVKHQLLTGIELGRQETTNFRNEGFFTDVSPTTTSVRVPLSDPIYRGTVAFRQSATSADNRGTAKVAGVYVQDQIKFSPQWEAILGLRYDKFDMDFRNNRTGATVSTSDDLLSPRAGLIYKPMQSLSLYTNYSMSYVPRAGEQLSSLTLSNQALEPEEFRNLEVGAKWDVRPDLALTAAVYRLDQRNLATAGAVAGTSVLVDGQRIHGTELEASGQVTRAWSVKGGYAYQNGEARDGKTLAQVPKHTFALWNRYDFTPALGAGLGLISRSNMYTSTSNNVRLPGYARVDAAVFYRISQNLKAQLNVENLLDRDYYASAHNDNNITPGSPRAIRLALTGNF